MYIDYKINIEVDVYALQFPTYDFIARDTDKLVTLFQRTTILLNMIFQWYTVPDCIGWIDLF